MAGVIQGLDLTLSSYNTNITSAPTSHYVTHLILTILINKAMKHADV